MRLGRLALWCGVVVFALPLSACARHRTAGGNPPPAPSVAQQIDAIAQGAVTHQHLAGLSLAVARDGDVVYAAGYGYRDVAHRLPATPNTIYNIASMSKQFTAACIMLLQQDGKLTIDDPLSKFIPDLPRAGDIKLRNLLNHTSGLPDYLDLVPVDNSLTTAKILSALAKAPSQFDPGSKYQYSNSNYVVLGVVVQKASGMPFDDFLRRRIFQPLHLNSTSIGTAPKDLAGGALGYTALNGRTAPAAPQSARMLDWPDGGINSTVLDLAKWDWALDSGRVVDQNMLHLMFMPGPHGRETTHGYGLGLGVDLFDGHREISHQGEWTGYAGENVTFPDDRFAVILLSNTDGFNEELIARQIFTLFFPPASAQGSAAQPAAPGESKAITSTARAWLDALAAGTADRRRMTPDLAASTSAARLAALQQQIKSYGTLKRFIFVGRDSDSSGVSDEYGLFYSGATVSYTINMGADGRIRAFSLTRED